MSTKEVAKKSEPAAPATLEEVLIQGDLAKLTPTMRLQYYQRVCESLGLNPLTRPFDYITLQGRLTLYAKRECTEQLRKIHGVSVIDVTTKIEDDVLITTCRVRDRDGKEDIDLGAVSMTGLKGEARANAVKKCLTQAKRRATLSICGLGWIDETETSQVPDAAPVHVDQQTGEILELVDKHLNNPPAPEKVEKPAPRRGSFISQPQRSRLWAIACDTVGDRERAEEALRKVCGEFGYGSTADITKDQYDEIVEAVKNYVDQPLDGYQAAKDTPDFFDRKEDGQ